MKAFLLVTGFRKFDVHMTDDLQEKKNCNLKSKN